MTNKIVLAFALALSLCFVACDKKEKELSDSEIGLRKSSVENENSVALLGDVNYIGVQAGESCLLVPHEGGHRRVVAACPTWAWPRVTRAYVSCPRVS